MKQERKIKILQERNRYLAEELKECRYDYSDLNIKSADLENKYRFSSQLAVVGWILFAFFLILFIALLRVAECQ